ncbi:hypothetical protein L1987_20315 [Smallanthus sonchifolius]|uniref:Uncharacterized protein n=1 Tax=Smallanthus sonchifolius TaxID=185202 RepID=A0ACB9IT57_9ASTR|nr:hypothetical protein L1987_20315 [Smallanthus sonchifolius]
MDEKVNNVRKLKVFKEDENISSCGYSAQSDVLKAKVDELKVTKRPTLNKERIDEVSKEVYSSFTTTDTRRISKEEKATWFKQSSSQPQETERTVVSFDIELENFTKEILRERIVSRRYDHYKDVYVIIRTRRKKEIFKNVHDIMILPTNDLKNLS